LDALLGFADQHLRPEHVEANIFADAIVGHVPPPSSPLAVSVSGF
jgi:hypothetical protein